MLIKRWTEKDDGEDVDDVPCRLAEAIFNTEQTLADLAKYSEVGISWRYQRIYVDIAVILTNRTVGQHNLFLTITGEPPEQILEKLRSLFAQTEDISELEGEEPIFGFCIEVKDDDASRVKVLFTSVLLHAFEIRPDSTVSFRKALRVDAA